MLLALPAAAQTATPTITPTFPPTATYRPPGSSGSSGSRDCGSGLPCGPIPWNLPSFPILASPTPMPTFSFTATPTPTMTPTNFTPSPTPTATNTPTATFTPSSTPTATPVIDTEGLEFQIQTLQAIIDSTPVVIMVSGTPVAVTDHIASQGAIFEDLFGRFKGIIGADWGPFTPLYSNGITMLSIVLVVTMLLFAVPIMGFLFGMVRKIYHAIMEFIPG
jgi:hypothetical protein